MDGALWYAKFLAEKYHVIAIASSGEDTLRISTWLHAKGAAEAVELYSPSGAELDHIVPIGEYVTAAQYDPDVKVAKLDGLMAYAGELHEYLRDHAGVSATEKPLLVALIAAAPNAFRDKPLSGRRKSVVTGGLITFGLLWGASLYAYMTLELSEFINHLLKRC